MCSQTSYPNHNINTHYQPLSVLEAVGDDCLKKITERSLPHCKPHLAWSHDKCFHDMSHGVAQLDIIFEGSRQSSSLEVSQYDLFGPAVKEFHDKPGSQSDCLNSEKYAYGWKEAGKEWYEAGHRLKPTSDFADATIKVADQIFGKESAESKTVREAWAEVKIFNLKPISNSYCVMY